MRLTLPMMPRPTKPSAAMRAIAVALLLVSLVRGDVEGYREWGRKYEELFSGLDLGDEKVFDPGLLRVLAALDDRGSQAARRKASSSPPQPSTRSRRACHARTWDIRCTVVIVVNSTPLRPRRS